MEYYGTHLSIKDGIINTINYCIDNNLKNCQIFLKSPQKIMNIKKISTLEEEILNNLIKKNKINLYVHSQYLINFCHNENKKEYTSLIVKSVIDDLNYNQNIKGVVIHMGKDTDNLGADIAFSNMKNNILKVLSQMKYNNNLILETSVKTKSDTCNFYKIETLAKLYNELEKPINIKFCIDTCHIFASGYDISTIKGFDDYMNLFDKRIGISKIELFHLNDSKNKCNSNVDRHENLLEGFIFKEKENVLKHIIAFCKKNKITFITETNESIEKEKQKIENLI